MPRNPEVTQQRLIDATAEIMASVGIAGLRVDQIAQRTGVNKRMIYHYFGNKEGLARRVLAEQVQCLCIGLPTLEDEVANFLRLELMADARAKAKDLSCQMLSKCAVRQGSCCAGLWTAMVRVGVCQRLYGEHCFRHYWVWRYMKL